jgi:hypothetical protein
MNIKQLINHLQGLIDRGIVPADATVWEERTGEHRRLHGDDITAGSDFYIYDADGGDCLDEVPAVVFGAWD